VTNLFRTLFCLGLMAFLMPHEPNLGFGRPATPFAAQVLRGDGMVNRMWDAVAGRLARLRDEFAKQDR
jgi:hypothetical protein